MPDVVLTEDARYNGVLAAHAGEKVPQELAEANEWEYAKPGTKKAQAAQDTDE